MAENTKIEWADCTFNPWIGCAKVSPGCDNCYAENLMDARMGKVTWGPGQPRVRTTASNWRMPLKWQANAAAFHAAHGRRQRVFCASLADVFDNEVPAKWRSDLFALIEATPNLDWLVLTKRVGNVRAMMVDVAASLFWMDRLGTGELPGHVWLGATVVSQAEADRDVPKLLAVPAAKRFLSIEPMLGPIDLTNIRLPLRGESYTQGNVLVHKCTLNRGADRPAIDWVIVGGESGPHARPMHPDWARSLRDQCAAAGVAFMFKQWGCWREPVECEQYSTTMGRAQRVPAFIVAPGGTVHCFENDRTRQGGKVMLRVGKKAAGRDLDGRTHDGFPA